MFAVELAHDVARDRQAEAETGAAALGRVEGLEQLRRGLVAEAAAGVDDVDADLRPAVGAGRVVRERLEA